MTSKYPLDQIFTHEIHKHSFEIHWTRIGPSGAPPLVLIHGTPWSSIVWESLATSLATRYSIYLYDHPGFGISPSPKRFATDDAETDGLVDLDGPLTLRAAASAALIKSWSLTTPPHVIAHDNGGLVSLRLYIQHSIAMRSLTLIDVVAVPPFGLPFFKLVAENLEVFSAIPSNMLEGLVHAYVRSAAHQQLPIGVEDRLCEPWLVGGSQGPEGFLRELRQGHHRASGIEDQYKEVGKRVPVKVIWGKEDKWLPCETAKKVAEDIGAEEVVLVEAAGHLIHYDEPARLAVEVGMWLEKHGKEKS